MRKIIASLLLFIPLALGAQVADIRVDYGRYASTGIDEYEVPFVQVSYSRLFWKRFAYKAGVQAAFGAPDFGIHAGLPFGVAFKPWTDSVADRLMDATVFSISDVVADGYYGRTDKIVDDILLNFLSVLFRRSEYFVGVTPGVFFGSGAPENRFSCTVDAGFVLGIPLWRVSLNVTPTYHYSLTPNLVQNDVPSRSFFSLTLGAGYMF